MIPISEARNIFTKKLVRLFVENIPVPSFLRTFFKVQTYETKQLSIEVIRDTEKIASDVLRGTEGNRNKFDKSSEKIYVPPYFNEDFDATQFENYDRIFGQDASVTVPVISGLTRTANLKIVKLRNKIERAKELQCAQIFNTGIVTMVNGDDVDFKRQATSNVDLGGEEYWDTNTDADIENHLNNGSAFIRNTGKNGIGERNLIMSGQGLIALKKTDWWQNNAKNFNQVTLMDITFPQKNSFGGTLHGKISAGGYVYFIWTYDEVYETNAGVITRYLPADIAIILPVSGYDFELSHAAVPAIIADARNAEFPEYIMNMAGEYYMNNFIDKQRKSHTFELQSAPLAIPITVDMIYTMKILGNANPEVG